MKIVLIFLLCASAATIALQADRKKVFQKHKQQAGIYRKDCQQ